MKTNTIKRFEKDLKEHGYEFTVVKELREVTRYDISKDGFTMRYEAWNVVDKPKEAVKWFEQMFELAHRLDKYEKGELK